MGRLDGKTAIVTGAAQGIGAAYAQALAGEGANVVLTDVDDCAAAAKKIESASSGIKTLCLTVDVGDEAQCADMAAETVDAFGRIDILVNNAALFGKLERKPFEEIPADEWDRVMAVNVRGPFLCAKSVAPQMRQQKYGKIINIASGTLFKGAPGFLHYVTSKGAVVAMTRSLSRELGDDNICVNTLAPGLTMSENVKAQDSEAHAAERSKIKATRAIKRDQMPEDLLGALIFLSSSESDFITGQCLVVDGGSVNH